MGIASDIIFFHVKVSFSHQEGRKAERRAQRSPSLRLPEQSLYFTFIFKELLLQFSEF